MNLNTYNYLIMLPAYLLYRIMKDTRSFTCDFVHLCDLFFIEPYSIAVSKYWMLLLLVITIENKMSIITKTYKYYTASIIPAIFLPCVLSSINFCCYFSNIHTYMCTYTNT